MFRKDSPSYEGGHVPQQRLETVIGDGTRFSGELCVDGDLRIDGEVEGQISVSNALVVGKTGVVKADIDSGGAEIAGRVVGKIKSKERVVLLGGSRLEGDVQSATFKIEDGAFFQGNCVMGGAKEVATKIEEPMAPKIKLAETK